MAEGLSAAEVGKELAEHRAHNEHAADQHAVHNHTRRDRWMSIVEAILLSVVALLAAWSGYSAAKWGTESSLSLAKASSTRAAASRNAIQGTEIRTLDSVSFNAAFTAFADGKQDLFKLAIDRMRPGYKPAVEAWLATHPLKNPNAKPDPSYMPQYRIPQEAQSRALDAKADEHFSEGQSAASTADKYVRLTVFLAAVLFLVGISSHFPVRAARYGLLGMASVMLLFSVVQLLGLPGPPA